MLRRHWGKITIATVLFSTFGLGMLMVTLWTANQVMLSEPELKVIVATAPELSATSYLVLDLESGTEIVSHNSDEVLPIASITKLFSAAAFRERTNLIGSTTVTWGDVSNEGRAGKLEAGQVYPYNELVQAMLVESSNDAASTIARADVDILADMNRFSSELGFSKTIFSDTSGLSAQNQSSAYELAQLTRYVWLRQPHLFDISSRQQIIGTYTGWVNNNPFVGMSGYLGGKHGFTYEANRTAVAVFAEPISGAERNFLYVVLGSSNLVDDVAELRTYVTNQVTYE